ncbi:MAG: 50S ribosomal protein L2 [Planctomycetota bacterium]|jgi:large subunit ribosomal protein L2|nr:50S ribosomal protein L2 [Planctomycetota bacterium]
MGIKKMRPMTPGTRHMSVLDYSDITKTTPERKLTKTLSQKGGRNHRGIITTRQRGSGAKRRYRIIDFKRSDKDGVTAKVAAIEYDPNRSANIALLHYSDGEKRYILAPQGLTVGMHVISGPEAEPEVGNCIPLENIPLGLTVHNVEFTPGQGGKFARAAGVQVTLQARDGVHAILQMPSGEMRRVDKRCRATIGTVGNSDHGMISIGKAGRKRHMGWRPSVRGSAMNPVDHPLGGGEGRHAGGHQFSSPSGVYARGGKTRDPKARTNKMIITKRKK